MAKVKPEQTVYIYGLHTESDRLVMYVGCSVNPAKRLREHIGSAKQGYPPKMLGAWIVRCLEEGETLAFSVLQECKANEGEQAEVAWIEKMRRSNAALLNVRRVAPYCAHCDAKDVIGGLVPIAGVNPGDTVINIHRTYVSGRSSAEVIAAEVVRVGWSSVLVRGLVDGQHKERWIPKDCLYYPQSQESAL